MGEVPNAAQAQRWNGESGHRWVANRDRHARIRERLTPHLFAAASIGPGDRVLDVGCGCGETTIAAAQLAAPTAGRSAGNALGLDLSALMLDVARRLATEAGVTNVRFVQGDAQVHPLDPASYDVVFSSFGVMFFDDPAAAFGNLVSALRPGGRLAFLCWQDDLLNDLFGLPLRALARALPLVDLSDDDLFADPERITGLLAGAGCTGIRVESVTEPAWLGSDVADVLAYVRELRPVRRLSAELDDEAAVERAIATLADEYAARQRPDGVWVGTAAWLVSASSTGKGRRTG
jgi:SAM-dependent methyltransferase